VISLTQTRHLPWKEERKVSARWGNGRFLSPDSEHRREDRPRSICGLCRTKHVSTHCLQI